MTKRLAITISGAVSLGSYEAGVLYEIVHAIGQHNVAPGTPPHERIEIDVITGASAGGMSATIAAQKLLFEAGALTGPYTNAFYQPWVADVSLEGLLAMHGSDDRTKSIFSSEHVADISRKHLTDRFQSHMDITRVRHAASARVLHLGLALANLNGVDYGRPMFPSGQFVYTRHQDELATWFDAENPADDVLDFWEPLRNAAVSCGAFPFAFRVVDVIRHAAEYADTGPLTPIAPTQKFAYTDGGTFQNQPLGLAKTLVDKIDHHLNSDSRFYLFVSPNSKGSTANAEFNAGTANYLEVGKRLLGSVLDQAQFQDWIMAARVNAQIDRFNTSAVGLIESLRAQPAAADKLQAAADLLLPSLVGQSNETLEAARTRLQQQFPSEYRSLPDGARAAWTDSVLVLETAAGLAEKDEMEIFGITAADTELAGADAVAFAGFFDRRYREHDYDVGRAKAQQFLADPAVAGRLGPIRSTPEAIHPIDHSLDGLRLDGMDRNLRERLRDCLRDRGHEILSEFGVGPAFVREIIDQALLKELLNKVLKL